MSEPFKRLYRSTIEARLAGVCGGIGLYLRVDPVVIRLLWVAITCFTAEVTQSTAQSPGRPVSYTTSGISTR